MPFPVAIRANIQGIDNILQSVKAAGNQNSLPFTKRAVQDALTVVQERWEKYASGMTVTWSGGTFTIHSVSGDYLRSIRQGMRYPLSGGFAGEIFSTVPYADILEKGQPARNMKPLLLASGKAKSYVGKDGKVHRYITIPFRHNVPGASATNPGNAMPSAVYSQAKQLSPSRIVGQRVAGFHYKQLSSHELRRTTLISRGYEWGERLGQISGDERRTKPVVGNSKERMSAPYTWKATKHQGMVRMREGNGGTSYITFRRLSDKSDPNSWWYPSVKPKPIRMAVVENTRDDVLNLIRTGFALDLKILGL